MDNKTEDFFCLETWSDRCLKLPTESKHCRWTYLLLQS